MPSDEQPRDTVPSSEFLANRSVPDYPDPTPQDLDSPGYEAVWQAIKGWDLARENPTGRRHYRGATGNDVMHILNALRSVCSESFPSTIRKAKEWQERAEAAEAMLEAIWKEIGLWEAYAEEEEDSHKSMRRIAALLAERPVPEKPDAVAADPACIYASCLQDRKCLYPGDGKCSLIERAPVDAPKLEAVKGALDKLIESLELGYGDSEEEGLDGVVDADLIYEDLKSIRALVER